jgi:uncharacterized protein YndB with AHSA1/START domain
MSEQLKEKENEIIITRTFDAPRELIWEAWTNPIHITKWWGPVGFSTTIEVMDVRPGGEWKHVMHGPDGKNYPNHSVFTEVVKPELIRYRHGGKIEGGPAIQFEMTWTFVEKDGKTTVTIHQVYPTAEMRNMVAKEFGAIEGGKQTLGRLGELLEKLK